jgi:hypothetical protein
VQALKHYTSHINKTMAVAFGHANIKEWRQTFRKQTRRQSHKIAEKEVRQAVRQEAKDFVLLNRARKVMHILWANAWDQLELLVIQGF